MDPQAIIKKVGDKWVLYTRDGSRRLGEFDSREAAERRERQIEYFKHRDARAIALANRTLSISQVGEPWGGADDYSGEDEDDED